MEVSVLGQLGEMVETITLDDAVFDAPMNNSLVHQALVTYQLNKRHGTHDTKTRAQVSGGGRKPWIQKHNGPSPTGQHPLSPMAPRRGRFWPSPAQLS